MPIKVRCPNPQCARVHQVKSRWAGKRGTCPACGCVIVVPAVVERDTQPLEAVPQEPDMEPTAEDEAIEDEMAEEEEQEEYEEERPRRRGALRDRPAVRDRETFRDREDEDREEEDQEEYEEEQPRKKPAPAAAVGWWVRPTTILTLVGLAAFVFVALVPVLPGPTVHVTPGPGVKGVAEFPGHTVDPDIVPTLIALVVLGCGLAIAGLVISRRRHDWQALAPIYGALLLAAIAVVKLIFQRPYQQDQIAKFTPQITTYGGQVTGSTGSGVEIAIIAGVLAMLAFAVAVVLGHKATWARIASAISILVVALVGSLVIFLGD